MDLPRTTQTKRPLRATVLFPRLVLGLLLASILVNTGTVATPVEHDDPLLIDGHAFSITVPGPGAGIDESGEPDGHYAECGGVSPVINDCEDSYVLHAGSLTGAIGWGTGFTGQVYYEAETATLTIKRTCFVLLGVEPECRPWEVYGHPAEGQRLTLTGEVIGYQGLSPLRAGEWGVLSVNNG